MSNKKEIIFITATNTDVGKSYACEVFLKKFASNGQKVGYYKPIETGVIDEPIDGTKLLNITKNLNSEFNVSIDDVVPYQFKNSKPNASVHLAQGHTPKWIKAKLFQISKKLHSGFAPAIW